MKKITFITGGQRSGKSSYAQKQAEAISENPVYLATSRIWDQDFKARIDRHKTDRGAHWINVEEETYISKPELSNKVVVLDCITLWLNNIFFDNKNNIDAALKFSTEEWAKFIEQDFQVFVVSNELGMGVHSENEIARKFADLQGWVNQHIASTANEVVFMVSGIPQKIK